MSIIYKPQKQKSTIGICEVHLYNYDDKKKRRVKLFPQCGLWVCKNCNDTVLIAMASVAKKQIEQNK